MFTAGDVLDRASIVLNDEDNTRWTEAELLGWLNDGAKAIVVRRPAAHPTTATLTLVDGESQDLPADAVELLDITCNISGATRGRAVTLVDIRLLDSDDPSWRAGTKQTTVYHYTYDERDPLRFSVYPPVQAGTQVESVYASTPAAVTARADEVDLPDEYQPALVSYLLYRSYAKDSEYANGALAAAHFQAFESDLGINTQAKAVNSPRGQS